MASIQILRRRIRSVHNTAKICRAMEMIATTKLKRTQDQALAGRPYTEKITQVIADLAARYRHEIGVPPLLERREVRNAGVVHIGSDRGLCGALNTNLCRLVHSSVGEQQAPVSFITVGKSSRDFARRAGHKIRAEFTGISDSPTLREILPISRIVIDDFCSGEWDVVYLAYPLFVNIMTQEPTFQTILPVEPAQVLPGQKGEYIFEPGPVAVLNELLPRFVEMQVYHAILELIASEQAARMIAMRNAGKNAKAVLDDLTLTLNKARQEIITKEICDITGGVEALKGS